MLKTTVSRNSTVSGQGAGTPLDQPPTQNWGVSLNHTTSP
jgi:hypothetical protein